jgi:hypothetical protein
MTSTSTSKIKTPATDTTANANANNNNQKRPLPQDPFPLDNDQLLPIVSRHQAQDTWYLLLGLRLANALLVRTFFQPDEYFQSLEPAWQLAFGEQSGAWITWVCTPFPSALLCFYVSLIFCLLSFVFCLLSFFLSIYLSPLFSLFCFSLLPFPIPGPSPKRKKITLNLHLTPEFRNGTTNSDLHYTPVCLL